MYKEYPLAEALAFFGWAVGLNTCVFNHPNGEKTYRDRVSGESGKEFFERVERSSPWYCYPTPTLAQFEDMLEEAKAYRRDLDLQLERNADHIKALEEQICERSLWVLSPSEGWTQHREVTWSELMAYKPRLGNARKDKITMTHPHMDRVNWSTNKLNGLVAFAWRKGRK